MKHHKFYGIVHCVVDGIIWASKREVIFQSKDGGISWQKVINLPLNPGNYLKSRTRLSSRLFRMNINHIQIVKNRFLVAIGFGRIFRIAIDANFKLLNTSSLVGKRPLVFCQTPSGKLLYGEYRGNPKRTPISIWQSSDAGKSWIAACSFDNIRHIHGVFYDSFEDCLWITTGDDNKESAIWKSSLDFSDIERVLTGNQQTRAITLQFTADRVFYGTDTPLEVNSLYSFSRKDFSLKKIAEVNGSVFHSCRAGGKMFFSTACEPSVVNLGRKATVYQVTDEGVCSSVASFAKDRWSMKYFQYGQVFLAAGKHEKPELWATPFATTGDQISLPLNIKEES